MKFLKILIAVVIITGTNVYQVCAITPQAADTDHNRIKIIYLHTIKEMDPYALLNQLREHISNYYKNISIDFEVVSDLDNAIATKQIEAGMWQEYVIDTLEKENASYLLYIYDPKQTREAVEIRAWDKEGFMKFYPVVLHANINRRTLHDISLAWFLSNMDHLGYDKYFKSNRLY